MTTQQQIHELREATGYGYDHPDGNRAYIEALEDLVGQLAPKAAAWDAVDVALRNNAKGGLSAADVCGVGFDEQLRLEKERAA